MWKLLGRPLRDGVEMQIIRRVGIAIGSLVAAELMVSLFDPFSSVSFAERVRTAAP